MPLTTEEKKSALVEELVARLRDRVAQSDLSRLEAFVREYYRQVGPEDLLSRDLLNLYGAVLAHWQLAQRRRSGERLLRVYNPHVEEHGWHSTHTVVEIVQEDMPFLVDSTTMELNRQGLTVHLTIHPVIPLRRDALGRLLEVLPEGSDSDADLPEAILHFEVDRQTDPAVLAALHDGLHRVLDDVDAAVTDWPAMRERIGAAADDLQRRPPPGTDIDSAEVQAFLRWLDQDHFTFLGYREYRLEQTGRNLLLRAAPDSGLGILRGPREAAPSESFGRLPPALRERALLPDPLILTKGSSHATVHRPGYLDYVGIRRFDAQGKVIGERRFLGRYTSGAYTSRPKDIPLLRHKVRQVMEWSGLRPGSHSGKALLNILETLPRDELIQGSARELHGIATGILHLQERQRVRLLVRSDPFHRFLSCLVFLPRDRFNTELRLRVQAILREAFEAESMDFTVSISESALARLYLTVHMGGNVLPECNLVDLEARIVAATRSWSDELHDALLKELGEEEGNHMFARYRDAFPASYTEDYTPPVAVHDIGEMEALAPERPLGILLYRPLEAPPGQLRIKLFRRHTPIALSSVLPMLENMGVIVTDERPHAIHPAHQPPVWVHDLGMAFEQEAEPFDTDAVRQRFRETFARVWDGRVENDGFNRLVLHAGCHWRQAAVLRAYCKYLLQSDFRFSQRYMEQVLTARAQITRLLVDLFEARFDPGAEVTSKERSERLSDAILRSLEAVPNLDEDRILRRFYLLIRATLRTNYYQATDGRRKPYLAFKFDPGALPDLPEPRPRFEIFVYSPASEGVHLRGGRVARGGIRWSDRLEDYRTEVFGLMKAQMVKNAVIVPVGAKGGFIVKQPPDDPRQLPQEVAACYQTFIRGLLDLTDNLQGARVIPPADTLRYDEDDPYLVVAADKGTATFSDLANTIAAEYRFWLGDAFASGGSAGYDHKKMGITARGGWESVKRHFRELGIDIAAQDFSVVGIGSMNGDVFGNGTLLSRHIRLLAAFSHQHIFLDPNPDSELSFAERQRLFTNTASWADYDPQAISAGGGVFPRNAKSIPLSPQVRAALDTEAQALPPNELIRAILKAPVDLLWNGGIGTFVKATDEEHEAVGDRANDPVRVDARELRCRVIGEGGNLGLTQRARIEFARHGGRVNADFIDNSGGVDCSDHEVNIKILLQRPLHEGSLDPAARNALLAEMTDEVAALVLRNNAQQNEALSMSEYHAAEQLPEHLAFMRALERRGYLERRTWALPDDEAVEARGAAGEGLTRPELAVLLSYSKIMLYDELRRGGISDDPSIPAELEAYFPTALVERFPDDLRRHRLCAELVGTFVANQLINRLGITAVHRISELAGASAPHIACAFMAVRRIFDLPTWWEAVSALDARVEPSHQLEMLDDIRRLANRATLWLLRNRPQPLAVAATADELRPGVEELAGSLEALLDPAGHGHLTERQAYHREHGVPEATAHRIAALPHLLSGLDITHAASSLGRPVKTVARLYFAIGSALGIPWLRNRILALPPSDHWSRLAREALRDDLYRLHRRLTVDALQAAPDEQEAATIVARWADASGTAIERYQQRMEQFRISPAADFALLSVALNELRQLLRSGGE